MNNNYAHGPGQCRECFNGSGGELAIGAWRLRNIPGYYGSSSPEVLVLGFSKGATQSKVAASGDFDRIAFAGARHRLQQVLESLGVMPNDRGIDALMTADERQFGVASLVRCSFCKFKGESCKTSGDVIPSAFTNKDTLAIIERCARRHLKTLPQSVKLVILLGTSDNYIKKTKALFNGMFSDYRDLNEVSFEAKGALWLYATHPSPGNGFFKAWAERGADDKSGAKRLLAQESLSRFQL